jgi:hypothetical protein
MKARVPTELKEANGKAEPEATMTETTTPEVVLLQHTITTATVTNHLNEEVQ